MNKITQEAIRYIRYSIRNKIKHGKRNRPQILSYLVTNLCNSHCITCSVWKDKERKEISVEELSNFLKDPIFQEIRHIGISGGEPSISLNLIDQIIIIINTLSSIETISITTNCIASNYWVMNLKKIYDLCRARNIYFQINISLDGIETSHDRIRGTKGNFENTDIVINYAKSNNIPYQLHSTINKYNIFHVNHILYYAKKTDSDIIFRLASEIHRLNNSIQLEKISLNFKQISYFCDFLSSKALWDYTKSPGRKLFYKHLVSQLLGNGKRTAPCYFQHEGLVLSSEGELSYCSRFSKNLGFINSKNLLSLYRDDKLYNDCMGNSCTFCYHDQTGLWPLKDIIGLYIGEKLTIVKKLYAVTQYLFGSFFSKKPNRQSSNIEIKKIAIIGMYGGEHVGDAAILGGVIVRLLKRYPDIKTVQIFSFRKDRTLCWIQNFTELPPQISIQVNDSLRNFKEYLKECQLLVWAGGPLMELPIVLSRNFYIIKQALAYGCRFEIEGIGYGPINTQFGRIITKYILASSYRVTVRSQEDKQKLSNIPIPIDDKQETYDPAFDYLKLLPQNLTLDIPEKIEIDNLLLKQDGQKIMLLNLRPLWNRYGQDTAFNFDLFLKEVACAIDGLSQQNIITIFVPMNADQYGFSDLEVSYALKDMVKKDSLFRIWETEATINSLVYILRKCDFSLCMRFHAAIFSLSQNILTFGIDYSLGEKGKVKTLFSENPSNCLSIQDFNADIFLNKLRIYFEK